MPGPSVAELPGLLAAFTIAVAGTRAIELFARRRKLYDPPTGRGAHKDPTPRLGGAAIAAATLVGVVLGANGLNSSLGVFVTGGAILLAVGVIDDLKTLPVLPRSVVQLMVASATAFALSPAFEIVLPNVTLELEGWPALVIVTIWIAVVVNAFNFMDGIDGMAAATAVATMPAAIILGGGVADALAIAIAGASLGFLIWNHHPASIFMGDGGSQFLGYAVAMAFLIGADARLPAIPMLLAVAPFLIDVSATLARRASRRESIFTAHNDHLYQRIVRSGASQRLVTAAYAVAGLIAGWIAVGYSGASAVFQASAIGGWALVWVFAAAKIPDPKLAQRHG